MLLSEWVEREGWGACRRLSEWSGVTYKTVHKASKRGHVIKDHGTAEALSLATRPDRDDPRSVPEVSIDEICNPAKHAKKKRRKAA